MRHLIIVGAGGHGRVALDIAEKTGNYEKISFLDDSDIEKVNKYEVIGKTEDFVKYADSADFFVAIGNNETRMMVQTKLENHGVSIATLIHPFSSIDPSVKIGEGSLVVAGAVINSKAKIGKGVIVNTCSSVDHDCDIGDYSHIAVGAHLAGSVIVYPGVMIGAGSVIINNVTIGCKCMIGAGAVVVDDILKPGTYIGVPARIKE